MSHSPNRDKHSSKNMGLASVPPHRGWRKPPVPASTSDVVLFQYQNGGGTVFGVFSRTPSRTQKITKLNRLSHGNKSVSLRVLSLLSVVMRIIVLNVTVQQ